MTDLYPFRFRPLLRHYLWGGRRFESCLGKTLGPGSDFAESWEICDHGADQSLVDHGALQGTSLGELVCCRGQELLGRAADVQGDDVREGSPVSADPRPESRPLPTTSWCPSGTRPDCPPRIGTVPAQPRFPLLVKFLDAAKMLSVQVHPNDEQAARQTPPDLGKTEAWFVLAADPGSTIYAGLQPGVDRQRLAAAIEEGTCERLLHRLEPRPGDCLFIPAGTVHALGAGLLVAEIQQASDTTFRLFDWNRLGPDGRPRALHVAQGLNVVDFQRGPIHPQQPMPTERSFVKRLVACDKFVIDHWHFAEPQTIGGDQRFHIVCVLEGAVRIAGDPHSDPLPKGGTALLPACLGGVALEPQGDTVLLDAYVG